MDACVEVDVTHSSFTEIAVGVTAGGAAVTVIVIGVEAAVLWPSLTATEAVYDPCF
jgi:hypothetical protein